MKKICLIFSITAIQLISAPSFADLNSERSADTNQPTLNRMSAKMLYDECKSSLAITKDRKKLLKTLCGATVEHFILGALLGVQIGVGLVPNNDIAHQALEDFHKNNDVKRACARERDIPYYELSRKNPISPAEFYVTWIDAVQYDLTGDVTTSLNSAFFKADKCEYLE